MENEEVKTSEGAGETPVAQEMGRDVRISKKALLGLLVLVLVCALLYIFRGVFVAAMVDGSPISRLAVIEALEKGAGKQTLEALVTQKIIENEIKKQGITITPEEFKVALDRITLQITSQGGTLEAALAQQGVTLDTLNKQITVELQVEKMLGEKIAVTDAEVDAYIASQKLNIPKDKLTLAKTQIADQMRREKISKEGQALVTQLRTDAKVSVFVQY